MKRLSRLIHTFSIGWVALAALVGFLLFTALVLPGQAQQAEAYSEDVGSPDSSFFYTADQLYSFAEGYGPEGRAAYIRARWTFDVVWPLVYTLFLTTAISWLVKKSGHQDGWLRYLTLLPLLGMLLDLLENTAASIVMARYPRMTPLLAYLAGSLTALKWILIGLSFAALFLALILILWKWVKKLVPST